MSDSKQEASRYIEVKSCEDCRRFGKEGCYFDSEQNFQCWRIQISNTKIAPLCKLPRSPLAEIAKEIAGTLKDSPAANHEQDDYNAGVQEGLGQARDIIKKHGGENE